MRKVVVALIMLAVLLAIVDRVAVTGVQNEIGKQIAAKYDLAEQPKVEITGIPFLTQALLGRYQEIHAAIGPMTVEGVDLTGVDATLTGVTAPLADLIQDPSTADIRAEHVDGTIVVSWKAIDERAPRGVTLDAGDGGKLKVSGKFSAFGQSVPVTADVKISVVSGGVKLTPVGVKVANGIRVPNAEKFLTFTVPVKNLPLHLKITSVKSTPEGLAIAAAASDVPLR
ncbi:hypothetical protein Pth03_59040 [Planotetraspora thailandica]|uniref:DUF2993 domain-containing protein n=1 Tax=Planotetraspora thailandica TaxID=487172 RepID=A0A8J3XYK7_9ACTN|nr:DUF2993 domain-containing protein [Planotetraspora thailandica]GII57515.1 hypothetical protein Pth03_59040 [Planotetraspora thailandica]